MAHLHLADQPVGPTLYLHGIRKRFHVPEGLEPLLDELSRHALRHQPESDAILPFLADFLEQKLETRKTEAKRASASGERKHSWDWRTWSSDGPSVLSDDELKEFVAQYGVPFEAAEHLATIIQAVYRGFMARKEYKDLIQANKRRRASLWDEWLKEGQFFAEGSDMQDILIHYGLTLLEANQFATKIQAVYRGHLTRKSITEEDPVMAAHLAELGITKKEATKHAMTIQSFYRSHRAKQELKEKAGKLIEETNAETETILEQEEQKKREAEAAAEKKRSARKSQLSLLEQLQERSRPKLSIPKEEPPAEVKPESESEYEHGEEEEYEGEGEQIVTDLDFLTAADLAAPTKHKHHEHHHKSGDQSGAGGADGTEEEDEEVGDLDE